MLGLRILHWRPTSRIVNYYNVLLLCRLAKMPLYCQLLSILYSTGIYCLFKYSTQHKHLYLYLYLWTRWWGIAALRVACLRGVKATSLFLIRAECDTTCSMWLVLGVFRNEAVTIHSYLWLSSKDLSRQGSP